MRLNTTTGISAIAFGLILLFVPAIAAAQQTVIIVRHAERADGGAAASSGMTDKPVDPPLSAAGEARAAKLAAMLADAGVTAIYTTEYKRTQDTAKPLAAKLGLKSTTVAGKDTPGLVARVRKENPKDVVLIVGHSNTIPEIIKALTGKDVTMRDEEYDAMFVLTPSSASVTLIRW